jgi:hypothetical protein
MVMKASDPKRTTGPFPKRLDSFAKTGALNPAVVAVMAVKNPIAVSLKALDSFT